jgi:hypothetical protein
LKNGECVIFEDSSKFDHIDAIDGLIFGWVDSLEYLFDKRDHLLNGDVYLIADSFIKIVEDVEIDDDDISVLCLLLLEFSVLGEEKEEVVSETLYDGFCVYLVIVYY